MALRIERFLTSGNADVRLAAALLGLGLVLIPLSVLVFGSLLLIQVSATLALAPAIYLLQRCFHNPSLANTNIRLQDTSKFNPRLNKLMDIAFWGLLIASLIIISQEGYTRPLSFLMLVSAMAAILAVEIFRRRSAAYCLIKILIIAILLRGSAWYQFPSATGTDPIIEMDYLRQMVSAGHLGDFMQGYQYYPMAYLISAPGHLITGLEIKDSMFILSAIEVISLIFVFLVGKQIFNTTAGLLAVLILSVFDWHIYWGFWIKAMTLGIALLPITIFFLLASRQKGKRLTFAGLGILFIIINALTHPFSMALLGIFLALGWISFLTLKIVQSKEKFEQPIALTTILLCFVVALGYWMFASGSIGWIANTINYALSFDTEGVAMYAIPVNTAVLTWQKLPLLLLLSFAIFGCLYSFNIKNLGPRDLSRIWFALFCGAIVIIGLIVFAIPELGGTHPMRWFAFIGIMAAFPAAYGLLKTVIGKGGRSQISLFFIVLLISGIMTTSHLASVDLVIPWEKQRRFAFTSTEMAAGTTVGRMVGINPGQTHSGNIDIYTDFVYTLLLAYELQLPMDKIVDASPLYKEEVDEYHGILLLREVVTEVVSVTFEGGHEDFVMEQAQYQAFMDDHDSVLIYDNGIVRALER